MRLCLMIGVSFLLSAGAATAEGAVVSCGSGVRHPPTEYTLAIRNPPAATFANVIVRYNQSSYALGARSLELSATIRTASPSRPADWRFNADDFGADEQKLRDLLPHRAGPLPLTEFTYVRRQPLAEQGGFQEQQYDFSVSLADAGEAQKYHVRLPLWHRDGRQYWTDPFALHVGVNSSEQSKFQIVEPKVPQVLRWGGSGECRLQLKNDFPGYGIYITRVEIDSSVAHLIARQDVTDDITLEVLTDPSGSAKRTVKLREAYIPSKGSQPLRVPIRLRSLYSLQGNPYLVSGFQSPKLTLRFCYHDGHGRLLTAAKECDLPLYPGPSILFLAAFAGSVAGVMLQRPRRGNRRLPLAERVKVVIQVFLVAALVLAAFVANDLQFTIPGIQWLVRPLTNPWPGFLFAVLVGCVGPQVFLTRFRELLMSWLRKGIDVLEGGRGRT